jgi:tetratricopeptide (TPR) repeat protein
LGKTACWQARAGDNEGALETLKRTTAFYESLRDDRDTQHRFLPYLIQFKATAGDVDGAFALIDQLAADETLDSVKKHDLSAFSIYNIIIYINYSDLDSAKQILDRATRILLVEFDVRHLISQTALSELIRMRARIGDFAGAVEAGKMLVDAPKADMKTINPPVEVLVQLALARFKSGDRAGGQATLIEAREMVNLDGDYMNKSSYLWGIAQAHIEIGDIDTAFRCISDMAEGTRHVALPQIASAQARSGDRLAAGATLRRAIRDAEFHREHPELPIFEGPIPVEPGVDRQAQLIASVSASIAGLQAQVGNIETALTTADSLVRPAWRAEAIRRIAAAQAASGDAQGVLTWARKRNSPDDRSAIVRGLAQGVAEYKKQSAKTEPIPKTQSARDPSKFSPKPKPDEKPVRGKLRDQARAALGGPVDAVVTIAEAQFHIGDIEGVKETLEDVVAQRAEIQDANSLIVAGRILAKAGDRDSARELFKAAARAVGAQKRRPDRGTLAQFSRVIQEQVSISDLGAANEALATANTIFESMSRDHFNQLQSLDAIVSARALAGEADGAFQLIENLTTDPDVDARGQHSLTIAALREIARTIPVADPRYARSVLVRASLLAEGHLDAERGTGYSLLGDLALARAIVGDFEGAREAERRWGSDAEPALSGKVLVLTGVALAYQTAGDILSAKRVLTQAFDMAKHLVGDSGQANMIEQLTLVHLKIGDVAGALRCVAAMPRGSKWYVLSEVGLLQDRSGQVETAKESYRLAIEDAKFRRQNRDAPGDEPPIEREPGVDPEQQRDAGIAAQIAEIQARAGDIDKALMTADSVPLEGWRLGALTRIAAAQAVSGNAQGVFAWAEQRDTPQEREAAFRGLARGLSEFKRFSTESARKAVTPKP